MALLNTRWKTNEEVIAIYSYMTDEELINEAFQVGREMNYEKHLLPHEREELRGIKAALLSRLRNKNKAR